MYSCTIRLTDVYSLTVRLAACLVLHYQAHILSLSGLLHVYSHSQARCLSILTLTQARCLSILTLTQARCLSILTPSGSLPVYSHSHSGSLPVYSHTIRLTACLFSNYQAYCLSILTLSGLLPVYSHTIRLTACLFSHSCYCLSVFTPNAVKAFLLSSSPMYSCTLGLTAYLILH